MAPRELPGPLSGVRVVDWTIYGVGPFATCLLAAMGADVIKVEQPPRGDPQQYIGPFINGLATLYINFNTGKRGIHLDMNQEADRESMWRLIEGADVMVTNFRAGVAEKFGFGQPEVLARNPEIIYLACNGWGETGPMKDQGGADPQVQAFCGWCSITGPEGGEWEFLRFLGHIDMNSSVYIAAGVLTGLVARGRVGGQGIRLSMLEAALSMQSNRLSEYLAGGVTPVPLGSASAVVAPSQAFECQDCAYVAVSAETEAQWERLVEALGRPELAKDARFSTNGDRVQHRRDLAAELGLIFKGKPATWWNFVLSRARVPVSRFWDWDLIHTNPQVLQNEHVVKVDTGATGIVHTGGPPWKFEEAPAQIRRNPVTGEHTKEVLTELAAAPSRPKGPERREGGAPFAGLRVLELASGLAGPHAGALLADLGAAVVKIETGAGDYIRQWGPPFKDGVGTAFMELNRNKRLAKIEDLGGAGRQALLDMVGKADVVIADAYDSDGKPFPVSPTEARAGNPRLIWCSVSAHGEKGPLAAQPGSELTVQAMSNSWAGLGAIGKPPLRMGADQASMTAGIFAYQGILAALVRRERTGRGDAVAVSVLGAILSIKGMHWTSLSNPDDWPGLHLRVWTDPPSNGYRTADLPILFGLMSRTGGRSDPKAIPALLAALGAEMPAGMDPLSLPGAPSNPGSPEWRPFFERLFAGRGWEELRRIFKEHGGEVTPFTDYRRLDQHPQTQALEPFARLGVGEARVVRVPWRMSAYPAGFEYRPAELVDSNAT